jgi:D-3-phosphoglycerate dehydrogenase
MKVLVADPLSKEGITIMSKCAEVDVKTGLKPEELIAIIGGYDALVVRSQTRVTSKVLEAG